MPLPMIDEGTVLDSFSTIDNGFRPLGHSTLYGAHSDDNASIFSHSTNSTASDLPGPGRVLGNAYSFAGKRLERTLGDLAHKAGFGPEAVYQQISTLYLEDWRTDGKKAFKLQKLCFKLFEHSSSVVDSTRFNAIMRWGDILRDQHEIYVWLFCSQQEQMVKHASVLLHVIEELRSTINTLSDFEDAVLSETSLLIDCHSVGLKFISLGYGELFLERKCFRVIWNGRSTVSGEETKEWGVVFQNLLESLPNPTTCKTSQWYIDLWSSQFVVGNLHASFALQSCLTLQSVLEAVNPPQINRSNILAVLSYKVHEYFVGASDSQTLLLAQWDDFVPCDGIPVHISTILNDLVRSYNRVFSSRLDIVPDLTCITMLGSTDIISADNKEKIRGFLKDLQNEDVVKDMSFTKLMLLRSCYRLLRRALSELDDADCFNMLSNGTSLTEGTRRCALLQLADILRSLPEVYMLLIILGGGKIRDSVRRFRRSLGVSDDSMSAIERYPGILINLRSLVACHAAGLSLMNGIMSVLSSEANEFIRQTAPFDYKTFRKNRDRFVPFLMNTVTFNPLIFYLKYCTSRIWCGSHVSHQRYYLLSCSIVQGALLMEKSVPQENRSAMEKLCRTMQNSLIERLRAVGDIDWEWMGLGHVMLSLYTDLTGSRQSFTDEAGAYLSQLCNLFFEFIPKTKCMGYKRDAIIELSNFFGTRNILGWFLSIRGPDTEEGISRLLEDIEYSQVFDPKEARYYKWPFSHLEAHKLGVELLAPRHERLHFEGAGLMKRVSTSSSELPLTPEQKERWVNAFETLAANLRSSFSSLINISLFYFANCPLPYEANPMFDTALALENCKGLQQAFTEGQRFKSANKEDLSRAVSHIYTCLAKRVEFVLESSKDLALDESPTFYGTSFDIPKVVKALNNLATLSKRRLGSDAPGLRLMPIPTADGHVFCQGSGPRNYSYPRRHWVTA